MKTKFFDGRSLALSKKEKLRNIIDSLKNKGVKIKLATILIGDDTASKLYLNLKKKFGQEIGVEVKQLRLPKNISFKKLQNLLLELNSDNSVQGIMVQMPLPDNLKAEVKNINNIISLDKDVDGLRDNSSFTPPTVKAVLEGLNDALGLLASLKSKTINLCVVGANGMVGKSIVRQLKNQDLKLKNHKINLIECDKETMNLSKTTKQSDIIISATGVAGLIKPSMVKKGVIVIDVGAPKGDVDKKTYHKSLYVSPVPGGIGPVTIACLFENLVYNLEKFNAHSKRSS